MRAFLSFGNGILIYDVTMIRRSLINFALPFATITGHALAQSTSAVFSHDVLPLVQEKFEPLLKRETGLSLESWENGTHGESGFTNAPSNNVDAVMSQQSIATNQIRAIVKSCWLIALN